MNIFAIAPHEFAGASFDPEPGAVVRHELGGKTRRFWLKQRDGILYFREATRVQIFAVTRVFAETLDENALIEAWKEAIGRDDYGVYFITHRGWPRTLAAGNFCVIVRADGKGWMREHFDEEWRDFGVERNGPPDFWGAKPNFGAGGSEVFKAAGAQFLERAVAPRHFVSVPARWVGGDGDEMVRVMRSAATLFFGSSDYKSYAGKTLEWRCRSNSAFLGGSVAEGLVWSDSYRVQRVWDIAKWHFGFVGVQWKKASDDPELIAQYGPRVWKRGIETWGENWRGNWIGTQFKTELTSPPLSPPSVHEKLEAALVLREFLGDKIPAAKLEKLLQEALDA